MKHCEIKANLCELFKKAMQNNDWQITHQDVGQTELVGYGYVVIWEKNAAKVILHYADRQGIAQANLEMTENAFEEITTLIESL